MLDSLDGRGRSVEQGSMGIVLRQGMGYPLGQAGGCLPARRRTGALTRLPPCLLLTVMDQTVKFPDTQTRRLAPSRLPAVIPNALAMKPANCGGEE